MNERKFVYIVYRISTGLGFHVRFENCFTTRDLAERFVKFHEVENAGTPLFRKSFTYFIDKVSLIDSLSSLGFMFEDSIK